MPFVLKFICILTAFLIHGCTTVEKRAPPTHFSDTIPHCQGHGCRVRHNVTLSTAEKKLAFQIFSQFFAQNPEREREAISAYIAAMEQMVGEKSGTQSDLGGTFVGFGKIGQLDCTDESRNTTTYLLFLKQQGLLRFHDVGKIAGRGFFNFTGGWPHQSAVIIEKQNGTAYAVDSWFDDNGKPPYILPLNEWKKGWAPEEKTL